VGLGIKTVADQNGLDFIPLKDEEYDLVIRRDSMDKPAIMAFLDILQSGEFKSRIKQLGYNPYL
jgi:putative molybdopterin biosynthesis protein